MCLECYYAKLCEANFRRGKMKKTNKTVDRGIFLTVQVCLGAIAFAMGHLVVVVQQVVHFLQRDHTE